MTVELKFILERNNTLNNMAKEQAVKLLWILGQSERSGNDIVDDLARFGTEQSTIRSEPMVGISYAYQKTCRLDGKERYNVDRYQRLQTSQSHYRRE